MRRGLKLQLGEWHMQTEDPIDPLTARRLQAVYDNWITGRVGPGGLYGPYWVDYRDKSPGNFR